ncbi:MAG: hypothetical protein FWG50_07030 [Kiritimatiellaeota bacterium]|nr:hypothetical protein [Kiritimatiellota bacterium]
MRDIIKSAVSAVTRVFGGETAIAKTGGGHQGVAAGDLAALAKGYLEDTLGRDLRSEGLRVTDVSCTFDAGCQSPEDGLYHISARFMDFPVNGRILSGRLKAEAMTVKSPSGGLQNIDPSKTMIALCVEDHLSEGLREAKIQDHVRTHHGNLLKFKVTHHGADGYAGALHSAITGIANTDEVMHFRAVFELGKPKVEWLRENLSLQESHWHLRTERVFSCRIPESQTFMRDIRKDLFRRVYDHCLKNGEVPPVAWRAKIESVTPSLKEGGDRMVSFGLAMVYRIKRGHLWGKVTRYNVAVEVLYEFDDRRNALAYKGLMGEITSVAMPGGGFGSFFQKLFYLAIAIVVLWVLLKILILLH